MPRQTILAYNLSDSRLAKLRFLCMKVGVLAKAVPAEDFPQPVGALCGAAERTDAADAEPFTDEMIVFCHMDPPAVSRFLQTAKQLRVPPFPLKAVLTPVNAAWNASQLHTELKAEREAIIKGDSLHE